MEKINMFLISNLFYSFIIIPTLPNYFLSLSSSFHCLYITGHLVHHDSNFYQTKAISIFTGLVWRSDEPFGNTASFWMGDNRKIVKILSHNFIKSSSPESIGQFQPNLAQNILG